jgi:glucose/arabinose dehydrogenase
MTQHPQSLLRRLTRGRGGRFVLAAVALVALGALGWTLQTLLQSKVYFVSRVAFDYYRDAKVPEPVIERLMPLERRYFATKAALLEQMRRHVGEAAFAAHGTTLERYVRTAACNANVSPRRVYEVTDSRGHPLYNSMRYQVVIPQAQLPPVTTDLQFLPGGEGALVIGKFGHVVWFGPDWRPRMKFQVPDVFDGPDDQGALGLMPDPDFPSNRFFYIAFVNAAGVQSVVQRFSLKGDAEQVVASRRDVIRLPKDTRVKYHGIGSLAFLPERVLLIQVGDPTKHAQAWRDPEGKLLAVVPDLDDDGGYRAPTMPFLERIRAFWNFGFSIVAAGGLRAPFSGTLWNNQLIMGDVGGTGPNSVEEINIFTRRGQNFGWGACEDPVLHGKFDPPIIAYRRSDPAVVADDPEAPNTDARSVIVGVVYDGVATDRYQGALTRRLLYSDFYLGFLRGARLNHLGEVEDDVLLTHLPFLTSMAIGPDGYIYGTTAMGRVGLFRVIPRRR